MLKRIGVLLLALVVLGLAVGDRLADFRATPGDRIFSKYKKKHGAVRAEIRVVGEELREILQSRKQTAAPRIYIALLAELARLNAEQDLIESWENTSHESAEYIALMADSLVVLEYLHMTAAYARAISESMSRPAQPGRTIAQANTLEQAARNFPRYYQENQSGVPIFEDPQILAHSRGAARLVPIAKELFESENSPAAIDHRVQFFARYADNIIEKNRSLLEVFQKTVAKK